MKSLNKSDNRQQTFSLLQFSFIQKYSNPQIYKLQKYNDEKHVHDEPPSKNERIKITIKLYFTEEIYESEFINTNQYLTICLSKIE